MPDEPTRVEKVTPIVTTAREGGWTWRAIAGYVAAAAGLFGAGSGTTWLATPAGKTPDAVAERYLVPAKHPYKNDKIELPPDQEVNSRTRVVVVRAKVASDDVQWIVQNSAEQPVTSEADRKTLLVYPNESNDMITIYAASVVDGKTTPPVRTTIKVIAPKAAAIDPFDQHKS